MFIKRKSTKKVGVRTYNVTSIDDLDIPGEMRHLVTDLIDREVEKRVKHLDKHDERKAAAKMVGGDELFYPAGYAARAASPAHQRRSMLLDPYMYPGGPAAWGYYGQQYGQSAYIPKEVMAENILRHQQTYGQRAISPGPHLSKRNTRTDPLVDSVDAKQEALARRKAYDMQLKADILTTGRVGTMDKTYDPYYHGPDYLSYQKQMTVAAAQQKRGVRATSPPSENGHQ